MDQAVDQAADRTAEQAWELEEAYWASTTTGEAADFYRHTLSDDVTVVIPGHTLHRHELLHHLSGTIPPWIDYTISEPDTLYATQALTVLTYHVSARGRTADPVYAAQVSSVYVWTTAGWALILRQHTPDPDVTAADWLPPSLLAVETSTGPGLDA